MSQDYDDMPPPPGTELDEVPPNGQQAALPVMALPDMSQATTVELGRAVAEVQAQVIVARQFPRNMRVAEAEMRESCSRPEMAAQAFYTYERGKTREGKPNIIHGPSVQLMREIGRCFGNLQSGIIELRRMARQSEMMAWAWDLEKNVRMSTVFYVTAAIDTKTGKRELTTDRDIYDNNANLGARREREMIRRVLPAWYVQVAITTADKTLTGTPEQFNERLDTALKVLARDKYGVTVAMLEDLFDLPRSAWSHLELVRLQTLYSELARGEITVADRFPAKDAPGSAAGVLDAAAQAQAQAGNGEPVNGAPAEEARHAEQAAADAKAQVDVLSDNMIKLFTEAGHGQRTAKAKALRLAVLAMLARDRDTDPPVIIDKLADLTPEQAQRAANALMGIIREGHAQERLAALAGECARLLAEREGGGDA